MWYVPDEDLVTLVTLFSPYSVQAVVQEAARPSKVTQVLLLPPATPHATLPVASNPVTVCPAAHACPPCTNGATFPVLGVAPAGIGPGFQFELAAYTSPIHTTVVPTTGAIHLTTLCHRGSLATEWGGGFMDMSGHAQEDYCYLISLPCFAFVNQAVISSLPPSHIGTR